MIGEAFVEIAPIGLLPFDTAARIIAGLLFGFLIGAISSVLGVAGGEVIIPTFVFGYGVPVKSAGSLSMLISLPTVLMGIIRHAKARAFTEHALMKTLILTWCSDWRPAHRCSFRRDDQGCSRRAVNLVGVENLRAPSPPLNQAHRRLARRLVAVRRRARYAAGGGGGGFGGLGGGGFGGLGGNMATRKVK